jgi:membrane protein DedA with SNARE-associated domain/rhodanese-related sulfurtransferase
LKHGYSVLFAAVFARQIGLPVPGLLFLVAGGALAGDRKLSFVAALGLAVTACVLADWPWYEAGRRWGDRVLHFIHGLAPDPDAAERRSRKNFARHGPQLLMLAKFVPGLDAVTPPLAGTSGTSRLRFLAFDTVGAVLYSAACAGLGYVFSHDWDRAAAYAGKVGTLVAILAFAGLLIYAAPKLVRMHRVIRQIRLGRITPEELKQKLDTGDQVFIVDLRRGGCHGRDRQSIPGAVRINPRGLERYTARDKSAQIPQDREVVLYCAREFTSSRVALALHRRGFQRVRPLAGGIRAWRERGFPLALG